MSTLRLLFGTFLYLIERVERRKQGCKEKETYDHQLYGVCVVTT